MRDEMEQVKITFIGCGNMGRSLIGGLLANNFPPENIIGADTDSLQRELVVSNYSIETSDNNNQAVSNADVVVLAVKPQVMNKTVTDIKESLNAARPLVISIAAGIRLSDLAHWSSESLAIVRAMPNTPAMIRTGASALFANENVTTIQRNLAEEILRSVGLVTWLEDESLLDIVTALSGSGPAYFFLVMEVLENAAIKLGLPEKQARILTLETALGAAKMALESKHNPGTLRQQVTSPGGTTEKAVEMLNEGNIEKLFYSALSAAKERSQELSIKFGKDK